MNTNPSLLLGLAEKYLEGKGVELKPVEKNDIELRVYTKTGSGYFFVRGSGAGRWYTKDSFDSDHFSRADEEDVSSAIEGGGQVQVVGYRSRPLATWETWAKFVDEINKSC